MMMFAGAMSQTLTDDRPSGRNGLDGQLSAISSKIERFASHGQMSQRNARLARREVNDLQAEVADDRLRNGGQLSEGDRFELQARIRALDDEVDHKLTVNPADPSD